jgi:site-specific DNA recombinase
MAARTYRTKDLRRSPIPHSRPVAEAYKEALTILEQQPPGDPLREVTLPVVIYAAKSTEDVRGSLETQRADCEATIAREGEREIIGRFSDEAVSGYKSSRGDGLAEAKARATEAAARQGRAELWVQHSDRLARGDGVNADHLAEIFFAMRKVGVRLRSVQDDSNLEDAIRAVLIGERNHEDSHRKAAAVRSGKDRQMQRGERLGGPSPDGLRRVVTLDDRGNTRTHYERDDDRAPIIEQAFTLSEQGMGDASVAGTLNSRGFRTKAGKPWTRRRVQDMLTNAVYAGRVVRYRGTPREEVAPATNLPALIDGERFDKIHQRRAARDRSAAGRKRTDGMPKGGRPTTRYALAKLGHCARCGGTMYARTSPYKRKDGTQARHYVCANSAAYDPKAATCDAPRINAEAADAAMIPHLRSVFVDFEGWIAHLTEAQTSDRANLGRQMTEARERIAKLDKAAGPAHERYVAALAEERETVADAALAALERLQADRGALAASLAELEATAAEIADTAGQTDAVLDWWNGLSSALRGGLDAAESMAEVNGQLRGLFSEVQMDTRPDGRYKLVAVFAERGEYLWPVDENYEPLFEETPDFVPDMVDLYVRDGVRLRPPVPLPVETARIPFP